MREDLMRMINDCSKNDISFYLNQTGNRIDIILNDCDKWGSDGGSVFRIEDKPEATYALIKWLEDSCVSKDNSFYRFYHFDDFVVAVGYLSQEV